MAFPIIPCDLCGSQEGLQRNAMKAMLDDIEKRMPGRKDDDDPRAWPMSGHRICSTENCSISPLSTKLQISGKTIPMTFDDKAIDWLADLLPDAAKAEIMPRFRRLGEGDIRQKTSAADLVTEADVNAERLITAGCASAIPRR